MSFQAATFICCSSSIAPAFTPAAPFYCAGSTTIQEVYSIMSLEFFFRTLGMTVLAAVGATIGNDIADAINLPSASSTMLFFIAGALSGLIITPWVTTRPAASIQRLLLESSPDQLLTSMLGLVLGLLAAALIAYPLSLLPRPAGQYLPAVIAIFSAYISATLFGVRAADLFGTLRALARGELLNPAIIAGDVLIDTSVIIDGRILDIAKTGFLRFKLLIPQFVIRELQQLADSSDMQIRRRGRHGLDILNQLRQESQLVTEIIDEIPEDGEGVDEMLVALAKDRDDVPILTNDKPLQEIARLRGIETLNVNELALAMRPIYLPEETINLHIIQEGKEEKQGIGYLIDGTMVVVENGREYRDRTIPVVITRYIISQGGKMYFARPADNLAKP
jgi:uncharacterized protein YacL